MSGRLRDVAGGRPFRIKDMGPDVVTGIAAVVVGGFVAGEFKQSARSLTLRTEMGILVEHGRMMSGIIP